MVFGAMLCSSQSFSQKATIHGNVRNNVTLESIPAVSIMVKETGHGTFTNERGSFKILTNLLPMTLQVTSIGFEPLELKVSSLDATLEVNLTRMSSQGEEVVVSATRVPTRILESPVSIERIGVKQITTITKTGMETLLLEHYIM